MFPERSIKSCDKIIMKIALQSDLNQSTDLIVLDDDEITIDMTMLD